MRGLLPEKILAAQLFHGTLFYLVKWYVIAVFIICIIDRYLLASQVGRTIIILNKMLVKLWSLMVAVF